MPIEDVVTKIKTTLQASLPAKLDTIETERGDGIVLDDIAFFSITRLQRDEYFARPALFILGENTPFTIVTIGGNRERAKYRIEMCVVVEDNDEERLQKKLWRYFEGIKRVLSLDRRLGETVHSIEVTDLLTFSNVFKESSTPERTIFLLTEVIEDYQII